MKLGARSKGREVVGWEVGAEGRVKTPTHQEGQKPVQRAEQSVWRSGASQFSSFQFNHSVVSDCLRPHGLQHARPSCPSPTPRVSSNSCPLSRRCHPTISSSVVPFSSRLQSFPASVSFQTRQLFTGASTKRQCWRDGYQSRHQGLCTPWKVGQREPLESLSK